jgi:hypothetical protein
MRKSLIMLAVLTSLGASSAIAEDDCSVPMAAWQPREAVERMAEAQGWTVRRIKIDEGCYEIDGRDVDGRAIEVTVDPATLTIIEFEHEDEGGRRGARRVTPAETRRAHDNGRAAPGDSSEREDDP